MNETDLLKFKNDIIRKFAYLIRMLNKELKKDIKRKGRVDTGLMMNTTKVKKLRFKVSQVLQRIQVKDGDNLDVRDTINEYILFTTNYYVYQDLGTSKIRAARFTRDTILKRHIIDLILETQSMIIEYTILVQFEGIGDEKTGLTS